MREFAGRPAGLAGVEAALRPWFATYPQPQRSEEEWAAFWFGYTAVLEGFPEMALRGAMAAWAKRPDAEFLPKPGALAELAKATPTPAYRAAGHAYQVLQRCDDLLHINRRRAAMETDGVKPEDQREAVAALLHDFKSKSIPAVERAQRVLQRGTRAADRPDAELPYSGGTPAPGSALTPQMLRLLGRPVPQAPPPADDFEFSEEAGG
jgi:hypothetical protein